MKLYLFLLTFLQGILISCGDHNSHMLDPITLQGKSWCVVSVSAPDDKLQAFINSACSEVNCKNIGRGGSCYNPDTLQNHASYVLNLYFRKYNSCPSDIGTIAVADPSFGKCHYT